MTLSQPPWTKTHTRIFAIHPRAKVPLAFEMFVQAKNFLEDARALGTRASSGQFYLYFQSIELAFKSYLHLRGVPIKDLLTLSHDLMGARRRCMDLGADFEIDVMDLVVGMLTASMKRARLRYEIGFELPALHLVDIAAQIALDAARKDHLHPAKEDLP
ncbi:hypothetical protein V1281_001897 [Nitrobacteraceae bacterium AZCC 2161]